MQLESISLEKSLAGFLEFFSTENTSETSSGVGMLKRWSMPLVNKNIQDLGVSSYD
jgi:hypothetical protein